MGTYVAAIGLALGRQSVLHVRPNSTPPLVFTLRHQLRAASFMWLVVDGGQLWQKVLYNGHAHTLVCLHGSRAYISVYGQDHRDVCNIVTVLFFCVGCQYKI